MTGHDTHKANAEQAAPVEEETGGGVRQLVDAAICLALAVILFRGFQVEGYMISTGSMAPTLLGFHKRVVCPSCRFPFTVGAADDLQYGPAHHDPSTTGRSYSEPAVCPNCGQGPIDVSMVPRSQGDQLLVHKHGFLLAPPKRWEVAVFRNPYKPSQAYVKRVIGLPGESIQVRDGDVYVNGEICRKELAVQRSVRIPVYDDTYRPENEAGWRARWTADPARTTWTTTSAGYRIDSDNTDLTGANIQEPAWVQYRHWIRGRRPEQPPRLVPVADVYGYNREEGDSAGHTVRDVMFSAQVRIEQGGGEFILQMTDGDESYACVIDPGHREVRLLSDRPAAVVRRAPLDPQLFAQAGGCQLEMSLFDRQILVALDGQLPFAAWPLSETVGPSSPPTSPARFGARGLKVTVADVKLYRDVFYTRGKGVNAIEQPFQLDDTEYFVLGDNSPVSLDSRSWADGALNRHLFIGKPFLVHLPSKPVKLRVGEHAAYFRVPDFTKIRYIR